MLLRVYYAHGMYLYNTPQEARDVSLLRFLGFKVVNPNSPTVERELAKWRKEERIAYFRRFADTCDLIAFRSLPDGTIGGGVAKEISWFQERHKPVIELPSLALRRKLDHDASVEYLREVGQR